jgi:hypothetical protein
MTIDNSKPAFPCPATEFVNADGGQVREQSNFGMTLREHYAGLAMAAIVGCPGDITVPGSRIQTTSAQAVYLADSLLAELRATAELRAKAHEPPK